MGTEPETAAAVPTHWAKDYLKRQKDSVFLRDFLVARVAERRARGVGRSYVLNLDASWGEGKTFFLERFKKDLEADYSVAYVNAWEDDHAEDPLLALMAAIDGALGGSKKKSTSKIIGAVKRASGKIAVTATKHALLGLSRRVIGSDGLDAVSAETAKEIEASSEAAVEDIIGKHAEAALKNFEIAKRTIIDFRSKLSKLVGSTAVRRPFFILIDELDRCRPLYAVSLLERVKHLFEIEDVVFVVATDTDQLRHAVTAVYGVGFDGAGYLLRFFDRTYRFAQPDSKAFVEAQFQIFEIDSNTLSSPVDNDHAAYFSSVARASRLSLREIERCIDVLRSAITVWPYTQKGARLELAYLLPLIVAHCRGDRLLFDTLSKLNTIELQRQWNGSDVVLPLPYGGPNRPTAFGIAEATQQMLERANQKLTDIANVQQVPAGIKGWVCERYFDELQKVRSGVQTSSWDGKSVIRTYPELVGSVGRLSGRE